MICPKCNCDNPAGFKYCGNCGTELPALLTCRHCGASDLPEGSVFCPDCGKRLKEEEPKPDLDDKKKTEEEFMVLKERARKLREKNPKGYLHFVKERIIPEFSENITFEQCQLVVAISDQIEVKEKDYARKEEERRKEMEKSEAERKAAEEKARKEAEAKAKAEAEERKRKEAEAKKRLEEKKAREEAERRAREEAEKEALENEHEFNKKLRNMSQGWKWFWTIVILLVVLAAFTPFPPIVGLFLMYRYIWKEPDKENNENEYSNIK